MTREEPAPAQKAERPRDELGRPLPWGSQSQLELDDYDSFSIEKNHRLAIEAFNAGRFFPAHEAWEAAWRKARGTPDEEFFKGLAQLGAGYTHYRRDNAHGARVLVTRALSRIRQYRPAHNDIDIDALVTVATKHIEAFGAAEHDGGPLPEVEAPKL